MLNRIWKAIRRHRGRPMATGHSLELLAYPGILAIAKTNGTEGRLPEAVEAFRAKIDDYSTIHDIGPAVKAAQKVLGR